EADVVVLARDHYLAPHVRVLGVLLRIPDGAKQRRGPSPLRFPGLERSRFDLASPGDLQPWHRVPRRPTVRDQQALRHRCRLLRIMIAPPRETASLARFSPASSRSPWPDGSSISRRRACFSSPARSEA